MTTLVIGILLALFGVAYNNYVTEEGKKSQPHGQTAIQVAVGVIFVIAAFFFNKLLTTNSFWAAINETWPLVGFFVAAGIPMIIGDMWRDMKRTEKN